MAAASLSFPASNTSVQPADAFALICACAGANPSADQLTHIAQWDSNSFDWSNFLRLAEHHGVLALAARNLLQHAPDLPGEIAQSLRSAYAANLRRNLWFAGELARTLQHLSHRDVHAIPYKGPVLAQAVYGDLGLRSFFDLDLLIPPAYFERAKAALAEIGFHPSQALPPAVERLFLRIGYERSFDCGDARNLLELQWNLLPYFYAVDFRSAHFRVEDLLARAGQIRLGAADIPCLSPEDSLLVLSLHAAKHLWTRLIWVADIAQNLKVPEIDFVLVFSRARKMGIARILGVSCWLAARLLHVTLPPPAHELLARDSQVPKLGEECAARLVRAAGYDFESSAYFRQIWKLRERASNRWQYLWRLLWTPGSGEIAVLPLPEILFPLYHAVRIARLARKLGLNSRSNSGSNSGLNSKASRQ